MIASFQVHPTPRFEFQFSLEYARIFTFKVHAYPVNDPTELSLDVSKTTYTLKADFERGAYDHVASKLNQMFKEKAREEMQEAEQTTKELNKEYQKWQAEIDRKQVKLDKAYAAWEAKSQDIHQDYDRIVEEEKAKIAALESGLLKAQEIMADKIRQEQASLTKSTNERSVLKEAEEIATQELRRKWHNTIEEANCNLNEAATRLKDQFESYEYNNS